VARYGNEQFEQIYPEDVAAVQHFYRVAPLEARVIGNNTSNPFRMGPFHDYRPAKFAGLAHPEGVDIGERLRLAGFDHGYVLVVESGIKEAQLREGAAADWNEQLEARLQELGARELFRERRAAVYELDIEGAAPVPRKATPTRTLASRAVRSLLDVPAMLAALALLLAIGVAGARHVGGRGRPGWHAPAIAWCATLGLLGIVTARFLALT
jgi:hypothetical protein